MRFLIPVLFIFLLLLFGCNLAENRSQQASKVIKDFTPSMTKEEATEYNSKIKKNKPRERETQSSDSENPSIIIVNSNGDDACKDRYIQELEDHNRCVENCEFFGPILYDKCSGALLSECGSPPLKPFCAYGL